MKIETITVMERKNFGNYEHIEITASARVEETEDAYSSLLTLKTLVHAALEGKVAAMSSVPTAKVEEVIEEVVAPVVKEKKPKAKKEKELEVIVEAAIPPVIEEPKKKEEIKAITYDSTIAEHKSILAGYLAKKYNTAWKTVAPAEEIKAFTSSLNGQPFIDLSGNILPAFLEQIHTFFGN